MSKIIIRATYHDNDYTHLIENYFEKFLFKNYYTKINDLQPEEYRVQRIESEELLTNAVYKTLTEEEKQKFIKYIKEGLALYIHYNKADINCSVDYVEENLDVTIIESLTPDNENGEVVYYILACQKYLTL